MVSKTAEELILELLREVREDQKKLSEAILEINTNLVGRIACERFRSEIWSKIDALEKICYDYSSKEPKLITSEDLTTLEFKSKEYIDDVVSEKLNSFKVDLVKELKSEMFDFGVGSIKNNRVLQSMFVVLIVGVYGGRSINIYELAQQYGWHIVLIWVIIFCLCTIVTIGIVWWIVKKTRFSSWLPIG
jgi:hypothetical protein